MNKSLKYKLLLALLTITGSLYLTGCFTSAKAYTTTKNPDGTITESHVSIVGTGDKASSIAAEGLFADGTSEDLGAGVKNANATQKSSGIDGTLTGVSNLMTGMANFMEAYQGRSSATSPASVAPSSEESSDVAVAANTKKVVGQSIIKAQGAPEIVILGNRATCALCKALWSGLNVSTLSANACGASVIDADKTENPSMYAARRPSGAFNWPYIRIYMGGNIVDEFSARGMSQKEIETRANKVIGDCSALSK